MKDYFLITSFTGGNHSELKIKVAQKLIQSIRKYFDNSFIVFIDSNLSLELAQLSDIYVLEKNNNNTPHGQGVLDKIKIGINILEKYNAPFFYKLEYDFHIDDNVFKKIKEWKDLVVNHNKKIISSRWVSGNDSDYMHKSIATAFGCYNTQSAKNIFNFEKVEYPMEMQIYKIIKKNFYRNECIIFESVQEALGTEHFDVFSNSGRIFDSKKLKALNINMDLEKNEIPESVSNIEIYKKPILDIYTKIFSFIKRIYNYI